MLIITRSLVRVSGAKVSRRFPQLFRYFQIVGKAENKLESMLVISWYFEVIYLCPHFTVWRWAHAVKSCSVDRFSYSV